MTARAWLRRLATPLGRRQAVHALFHALWPVLRTVASWYRVTIARRTRVVVVIGSLGKTTATRLIWSALGEPGHPPGGRNGGSFLARELFRIRPWSRWAVMEVGIRGFGRMEPYARMIRPDVVVVTRIASDHSRTFETLDETRDEKARMLTGLRASGVAILNGDDPHVRRMADATDARVMTYGFGRDNQVRAISFRPEGPDRSAIEIEANGERCTARVRLVGRHSAYAVLAAAAVGLEAGRSLEESLGPVADIAPRTGRMQPIPLRRGAWLIRDDYKASVETVRAALDAVAALPAGRRIVVLGEMEDLPGPHRQVYKDVGVRLAEVADHAILVCSRTGFSAYRSGGRSVREDFEPVRARDWREARAALDRLDPGPDDLVLVKGRASQRLARLSLALEGHDVGCMVAPCRSRYATCDHCPALAGARDP